jgi:hypothetical protein
MRALIRRGGGYTEKAGQAVTNDPRGRWRGSHWAPGATNRTQICAAPPARPPQIGAPEARTAWQAGKEGQGRNSPPATAVGSPSRRSRLPTPATLRQQAFGNVTATAAALRPPPLAAQRSAPPKPDPKEG